MTKKNEEKSASTLSYEDILNASNLNEAQKKALVVYEKYRAQNPKKFEEKRNEIVKKLIKLVTQ